MGAWGRSSRNGRGTGSKKSGQSELLSPLHGPPSSPLLRPLGIEFPEPRPGPPFPSSPSPSPDLPSGSQMKGEVVDCPILRCASYRMGRERGCCRCPAYCQQRPSAHWDRKRDVATHRSWVPAISWGSLSHGICLTVYLLGTNDPCTRPAENQSLFQVSPAGP